MCDCEGPKASNTWVVKKARKAHDCCECGDTIEIGSPYQITSGIWDEFVGSFKTCLLCVGARADYEDTLTIWDCRPCLTGLWDDAQSNDWFCKRGFFEDMVAG